MAGLVPAIPIIWHRAILIEIAGTSPAMTLWSFAPVTFDARLAALIPSTASRAVVITILTNGDRGRTADRDRTLKAPGHQYPRRGARCDSEMRNMGMVTVIAIILADLLVFLLFVYQYRQETGLTVKARTTCQSCARNPRAKILRAPARRAVSPIAASKLSPGDDGRRGDRRKCGAHRRRQDGGRVAPRLDRPRCRPGSYRRHRARTGAIDRSAFGARRAHQSGSGIDLRRRHRDRRKAADRGRNHAERRISGVPFGGGDFDH